MEIFFRGFMNQIFMSSCQISCWSGVQSKMCPTSTLFAPLVGKFIARKISFNLIRFLAFNSTSLHSSSLGLVVEVKLRKGRISWHDSGTLAWHHRRTIDAIVLVMAPFVALIKLWYLSLQIYFLKIQSLQNTIFRVV